MRRIIVLILLLSSLVSNAQIGGESTFQFLNVPVSARVGALGGNVIAVKDDDPNLAISNPSLLTPEMNGSLSLTYMNYFADINYGYFSYVKDFKKAGTFSSGIKYIDYGSFIETDEGGNELGNFRAAEYALILGWGKSIDSSFSVGANLKPIYSNLYTYSSVGIALDISGTYYNQKKGITIAALIKNMGTQLKPYVKDGDKEPLPFEVQLGMSKKLKHVPLRISLDLVHLENWNLAFNDSTAATNQNNNLTDEEKSERNKTSMMSEMFRHIVLGAEFVPSKSFMVRLGFNFKRRSELAHEIKPGIVGFSFGLGFRVKKIHISYGYAKYHLAGSSNHFTITTNLSDYYKKGSEEKITKKVKVKKEKTKKVKKPKKEKKENG
jgi:hypothetical protein